MKRTNILKLIIICILSFSFWSCNEKAPLDISEHDLDVPNSPPVIDSSMVGDNYSVGYYNGTIRSNKVELEWLPSDDINFLTYKIFKSTGELGRDIFEGFESGSLPESWITYGDDGGWYVTAQDVFEGNFSIRSPQVYDGDDYLEKVITVPHYSEVSISFYGKGVNDGDGYLYINGEQFEHWGYDYYSENWEDFSCQYYTGSNNQVTLKWVYSSENYGYGLLDNIEIAGVSEYSLIETIKDKNTRTYWDTTLVQNQYYSYKIATIVEEGTDKVDEITIKTPLWQAPSNLELEGLSPTVAKLNWEDNTESETEFQIYIDSLINYNYVNIDSNITADKNATSKIINDLETDAEYRFRIKALNQWEQTSTDNYSGFEIEFGAPSLQANQVNGTKAIDLSWDGNSNVEDGFKIERDIGNGFELLITVTENTENFRDNDTTAFEYDSTYTYRVRSYNSYNETVYSDYSNEIPVTLSEFSCDFDSTSTKYWYTSGASTHHNFYPDVSNNCNGTLIVTVDGDYDSDYEYAEIYVDGNSFGSINPDQNGATTQEFSLPQNYFNDGYVNVSIYNSDDVDTGYGNDLHTVQLIISD